MWGKGSDDVAAAAARHQVASDRIGTAKAMGNDKGDQGQGCSTELTTVIVHLGSRRVVDLNTMSGATITA